MNSMTTTGKSMFIILIFIHFLNHILGNRIFFEACDGVFLNYTWNVDNLSLSASNAGDRILDVYVGVDVFGRNCYGGGGFNTSSALSVIRQNGLSAAIFAPGWIYETHPVEQFHELSSKFWLSLLPDLNIHDLMIELPMETSFCPGHGKLLFRNGQVFHLLIFSSINIYYLSDIGSIT